MDPIIHAVVAVHDLVEGISPKADPRFSCFSESVLCLDVEQLSIVHHYYSKILERASRRLRIALKRTQPNLRSGRGCMTRWKNHHLGAFLETRAEVRKYSGRLRVSTG